nr:CatA-like O-acetyltransferase [Pseudoalteromonas sp. C2R02]
MDYFHDENHVTDPYLTMTLNLDLTQARSVYENSYKAVEGASFQAYLVWNLSRALQKEWTFSTRNIDGTWYLFTNLPIFTPIAVGGDLRFKDVIIENSTELSWQEFAQAYRNEINNENAQLEILPQKVWALCPFIGNLPNMNFTSFQVHRNRLKTGRPLFYFGKRVQTADSLFVPLSISIDHANADPFVLDRLISSFQSYLCNNIH